MRTRGEGPASAAVFVTRQRQRTANTHVCVDYCLDLYLIRSLDAKHQITMAFGLSLPEFDVFLPALSCAFDPIHPSLGLTLISLQVHPQKPGNKYFHLPQSIY